MAVGDLNEATKTSIGFKKIISKDHRFSDKQWFEETDGGGMNIHASDVWNEEISATPPATSTDIIDAYTDTGLGALKLTEDTTVPNQRGWAAGTSGTVLGDVLGSDRLRGWVPPKFGLDYTVKVYVDNGSETAPGAELGTTDDIGWFFDYETGYLAIQNTHSLQTPFWIKAYQYVGKTATDPFTTLEPQQILFGAFGGSGSEEGTVEQDPNLTWDGSTLFVGGDIDLDDNEINEVHKINYHPDALVDGLIEGATGWDANDHTLSLSTGLGPVLQVGQEIYVIVINDSGEDILNGEVVRASGIGSGRITIAKASAETHVTLGSGLAVAVATMDIPNGTEGIVTSFGIVRGINTTAWAGSPILWVDPVIPGALTNVKPAFPDYVIQVGAVTTPGVNGEITVEIKGTAFDTTDNFWNGTFRETISFTVSSDISSGEVYGSLEPANGHDDMTMIFSDGLTLFEVDSDPSTFGHIIKLLPSNDDAVLRDNYIYITQTNKVLEVTDTDWPTEEHIKVAHVVLRTADTTVTDGALKNQNWNDHIQSTATNQGHLSHITERLRQENSKWDSGVALTPTPAFEASGANVYVRTTQGVVYQLHKQIFPPLDMETGDDIHIVNHPTAAYQTVTNLNTQLLSAEDSDGNTHDLKNSSYSIVIWGVANKTGQLSHLMANLPINVYSRTSPADAVADADNYSVYDIPKQFQGVGFLISRITYVLNNAGTSWTTHNVENLRGKIPNTTAGGGGGGGGGVDTFTALTDTPAGYGVANQILETNGVSALSYTSTPTLDGSNITSVSEFTVVTNDVEAAPLSIVMVDGTTGSQSAEVSTDFAWQPSIDTLWLPEVAAIRFASSGQIIGTTDVLTLGGNGGSPAQIELDASANLITFADNVVPDSDNSISLGSSSLNFAQTHTKKLFAVNGDETNATILADAGIVFGYVDASSSIQTGAGGTDSGSLAGGRSVVNSGIGGDIQSSSIGFAHGFAKGGEIVANSDASFAQGYAARVNTGNYAYGRIKATNKGASAQGYARDGSILASGVGSIAQGDTQSGGTIRATQAGSFAQGEASTDGYITSSGGGSFAQGTTGFGATIQATTFGAVAHGYSDFESIITSSGLGSFAQGYTSGSSGRITASGSGSLAFGASGNNGVIAATTSNAFQFGPGTNSTSLSLQVGDLASDGVILKGTGDINLSGDLLPKFSGTGNIGSSSLNFAETHTKKLFAVDGYEANATIGHTSGIVFGYIKDTNSYIQSGTVFGHKGAFAGGYVNDYSYITASNTGAFAHGHADDSYITASSQGSFAQGFVSSGASIESTGKGSFAQGYASSGYIKATTYGSFARGFAAVANIKADGWGSFAMGNAFFNSITASADGAFAFGDASGGSISASATNAVQFGPGSNSTSNSLQLGSGLLLQSDGTVTATTVHIKGNLKVGAGTGGLTVSNNSFAGGDSQTAGINATGNGSMAFGMANFSSMYATGNASFALGRAQSGRNITASGDGSFAQGYADTGSITASADNAVQFGPGTNSTADTLQVGSGVILHGIPSSGQSTIDKGLVVNEGGTGADSTSDFRVETNNNANALIVDASADEILMNVDVSINSNSAKLYFGEAQNASIYFDGTDLNIDLDDPSTGGIIKLNDDVQIAGTLTVGTGSIVIDGENSEITSHQGLIKFRGNVDIENELNFGDDRNSSMRFDGTDFCIGLNEPSQSGCVRITDTTIIEGDLEVHGDIVGIVSVKHPHNMMTGLDGGQADQYYHLTNNQHGILVGGSESNADALHTHTNHTNVASNITVDVGDFSGEALTEGEINVQMALAKLDAIMSNLVPLQPDAFPSSALSIGSSGTSPLLCSQVATQTPDNTGGWTITQPLQTESVTRVVSSSVNSNTILNSGPGNSGTITAYINNVDSGNIDFTKQNNDPYVGPNDGDNGSLRITNNDHYPLATPGFWEEFDTQIRVTGLSTGWNRFKIDHDEAGDTGDKYFVYDNNNSIPVMANGQLVENNEGTPAYSSGIKHYNTGASLILSDVTMTNIAGETYYNGNDAFGIQSTNNIFTATNYTLSNCGIAVPVARQTISAENLNSQTFSIDGINVHNVGKTQYKGRNVRDVSGIVNIDNPQILVMNGSAGSRINENSIPVSGLNNNESKGNGYRIKTGNGDAPDDNTSYAFDGSATNWNNSDNLSNWDAAIVGGYCSHNQINYSQNYLPAGNDLSDILRNGAQYISFWFSRTPVSKFDIEITGKVSGCWVKLLGFSEVYATTNGWWSMTSDVGTGGIPGTKDGSNGSNGVGYQGTIPIATIINNERYTCSFETANSNAATNESIIVRFKLTSGDYISALTFKEASH